MLDAYAVRKAIPRVVVAVVAINLSIYLCLAALDITNIVGRGVAQLLTAPFHVAGTNVFTVKTDAANSIAGGVGLYAAAGPITGAMAGLAGAGAAGAAAAAGAALSAMLWMLIPILLLVLAILATVIIRQGLLFFLIVTSPVAIALFILPGTEKYFQKWMDTFVKTLLVYPIIAVIFAMSDVFGSIIFKNNSGGVQGIASIVTGVAVIFAPLFLIPFAFRFAGGAMGAIIGAATGMGDKISKSGIIKGRQEHYGQKYKDQSTRNKAEAYRRSSDYADSHGGMRGRAAGWRARKISGYKADIYDREAELNARMREEQSKTTNNGDDTSQRAYTVSDTALRRNASDQNRLWREVTDANGNVTGHEYRTAGGAWVSQSAVSESRRKYGNNNTSQLQQSMAYEMSKATTQEQQDSIVTGFGQIADDWGMSESQANGVWIGSGFANQDTNLQWKHGRWNSESGRMEMSSGGANLIKEVDEKKDAYTASRQNADTWTAMSQQVMQARQTRDQLEAIPVATRTQQQQDQLRDANDTLHRASRIVSSIRTRQPARDDQGNAIPGQFIESVGAGAAGRVQEEMKAFASITDRNAGVYSEQVEPGPLPPPDHRQAGTVYDSSNDRDRTPRQPTV